MGPWNRVVDLLVTAGHCVCDWENSYGRAITIEACIGYHGEDSVTTDPNVQFRRGIQAATTAPWLSRNKSWVNDVGFVRLESGSQDVVPFEPIPTPVEDERDSIVVGYPGDKSLLDEIAAEMYQGHGRVKYNLREGRRNMLEYRVSTSRGMLEFLYFV